MAPNRRVTNLRLVLVGVGLPERVVRHARGKAIVARSAKDRELHRRIRRVVQIRAGEAAVWLLPLIVQLAPVLHAKLVRQGWRDQAVKLDEPVIQFHKIGAEAVDGVVV